MITLRLRATPGADPYRSRLELDTAARLCGVTEPVIRDPTVLRRTGARAVYEAMIVRVRGEMEPDEWECGYLEGAKMSFEKALDAAAGDFSGT